MKTRLPAATLTILAALLLVGLSAAKATVVTYIDLLNTTQTNTTYNSSVTNTIASAGALGGFRTMTLTSSGNDINDETSTLRVMTNAAGGGPRMVLSSGNDVPATFHMTWGGAGGTAGLGGIDIFGGLGATNVDLTLSTLNFSLRTADLASPYTWSFTDTNNVTATYASTFPVNATPSIDYAISLASFANGGTIDWSAINFITLSGGGVPSLDLVLGNSFSVTASPVPEPGTWAAAGLLVLTAFYIRRRRMRATTEEAPTAA